MRAFECEAHLSVQRRPPQRARAIRRPQLRPPKTPSARDARSRVLSRTRGGGNGAKPQRHVRKSAQVRWQPSISTRPSSTRKACESGTVGGPPPPVGLGDDGVNLLQARLAVGHLRRKRLTHHFVPDISNTKLASLWNTVLFLVDPKRDRGSASLHAPGHRPCRPSTPPIRSPRRPATGSRAASRGPSPSTPAKPGPVRERGARARRRWPPRAARPVPRGSVGSARDERRR
jgi:hypothetical protein